MKTNRFVFNKKSILLLVIVAVMIVLELHGGRSYFDEFLAIIAICYVASLVLHHRISKWDLHTIILLLSVIAIGTVSNITSGLNVPTASVLIDIIAETKILWVFFAVKYYAGENAKRDFVRLVTPFAKIFCIIAFICGVITQFYDIGMSGDTRYGITAFRFIFPMSFQFLAVGIVMFAVLTSNAKVKHVKLYYIMGCISLILATKSSPLLFAVMFLILTVYFKKNEVIKTRTIVFLALIVIILGAYQIHTYLLNEDAPRYLFFYYGGVTANNYFPLGSGFATFGSDQAARVYSPLYYEYGFNNMFGMTVENSSFLSDTFWAMAIGQFGWIGFFLYVSVFVRIFLSFKGQIQFSEEQKAFVYSAYIQYIVHAVGSAILSSSAGMLGFIVLGMLIEPEERINMLYGNDDFVRELEDGQ